MHDDDAKPLYVPAGHWSQVYLLLFVPAAHGQQRSQHDFPHKEQPHHPHLHLLPHILQTRRINGKKERKLYNEVTGIRKPQAGVCSY